MISKTTAGKEVRYWDFARTVEVKAEDGTVSKVGQPDWVKQPVEVTYQIPESLDEALTVSNGDEKRLLELVAKGLEAEAEEKGGSTPVGTFSVSMVKALDSAMKVSPQFASVKKSSERRKAILTFIGSQPALKDAYLLAFEPLRNIKTEDDDSE